MTDRLRQLSEPRLRQQARTGKSQTRVERDILVQWVGKCIPSTALKLKLQFLCCNNESSGAGCSKLMMSLVNVSLIFLKLISQICQYFFLKKRSEAFALQKLLSFFQQKISVYLVIKSENT